MVVMALWAGLTARAAYLGLLSRFDITPPPFAVVIALVFILPIALGMSGFGAKIARHISMAVLVLIQSFRLPLELIMHRAAGLDIMPDQLSYSGYNFDILTGIGALILGIQLFRGQTIPRWVIYLWNSWGVLCLLVIAFVAITASPVVQLYGSDPASINSWVLYFPYIWLPALLVTNALFTHIIIFRKLSAQ